MTRNLKALGLAMLAVFAFGAVMASAASASTPRITVGSYPATIKGSGTMAITLPGGRLEHCEEVKYEAEYTKAQSEAATWSLSVTPSFAGAKCTATILGNVTPMTVTMNGCYLTFTDEETKNGSTTEQTGSTHIKCPVGKKIETHVWSNSAHHLENGTPLCTYTIEEQGPLKSVTYKLSGPVSNPHTFLTTNNSLSLTVNRSGGTLTNCGAATQTATLATEAKFEAFDGALQMLEWSMDPS